MMERRVIQVDRDFYVKLSTYLKMENRWVADHQTDAGEIHGIVLLDPVSKQELLFVFYVVEDK